MTLRDIIDKQVESKLESKQLIKRLPARLTAVSADYKRADVELSNGTVIKDMLNKSNEIITAGQSVYVEYMTLPSSGWIAMTTGEAVPMGGSGAEVEVENAAIMSTDFEDFVVTEELMLDISPATMLYYGAMPAFAVVQGHYCLFTSNTDLVYYNANTGWLIGQTAGLYERIIANKAKFGSQIGNANGGGFLSGGGSYAYPENYAYIVTDITAISASSYGIDYTAYLSGYIANVNAPAGNWWESPLSWGSFTRYREAYPFYPRTYTNTTAFDAPIHDIFVVPVISAYNGNTNVGALPTPYASGNLYTFLVFASTDGVHYGVTTANAPIGSATLPLVSEAEKCFTLGITQRTEPVTGGGS